MTGRVREKAVDDCEIAQGDRARKGLGRSEADGLGTEARNEAQFQPRTGERRSFGAICSSSPSTSRAIPATLLGGGRCPWSRETGAPKSDEPESGERENQAEIDQVRQRREQETAPYDRESIPNWASGRAISALVPTIAICATVPFMTTTKRPVWTKQPSATKSEIEKSEKRTRGVSQFEPSWDPNTGKFPPNSSSDLSFRWLLGRYET